MSLADQVGRLRSENTELTSQNTRLANEKAELAAKVAELEAKLERLDAELEKLRREQGRNSSNSGKPPSSDSVAEKAIQAEERLSRAERRRLAREKAKKFFKERVKRSPGKQPGAAGAALARAAVPDREVVHAPRRCSRCGESLGGAEVTAIEVRQVFDLPERRLEVTEHRSQSRRCRCGTVTKAPFPDEAKAPACYGPVLRATAVYLMVGQHVPVARAAELLSQVCGAPVSTGWLAGLAAEAAEGLAPFLSERVPSSSRPTSCTPTRPALVSLVPATGSTLPARACSRCSNATRKGAPRPSKT